MLLGPMSAEELRQAIVEPARLAGTHILKQVWCNEFLMMLVSESGNLPLLEFALTDDVALANKRAAS